MKKLLLVLPILFAGCVTSTKIIKRPYQFKDRVTMNESLRIERTSEQDKAIYIIVDGLTVAELSVRPGTNNLWLKTYGNGRDIEMRPGGAQMLVFKKEGIVFAPKKLVGNVEPLPYMVGWSVNNGLVVSHEGKWVRFDGKPLVKD